MRKVRLNSSIVYEKQRQLIDDMRFIGDCVQAVEMFVAAPGPDVDTAVKAALTEMQKQLDQVMKYMGMLKMNSAKLPVGGEHEDVDSEFMDEVDSILGLEDGQSIDISKARLAYNEDTQELMLTDEDDIPEGYEVVGEVVETPDTDDSVEETETEDEGDEAEAPVPEEESEKSEIPDESEAAPKSPENEPAEAADNF